MASFAEADAIIAPAPPPASYPDEVVTNFIRALILIILIIVAVIMAGIMLVGSLRKRTSSGFFKSILMITVLTTPYLIAYTLPQMTWTIYDPQILPYAFLPIWGILLLAWLGSYGTISAFQLADNESAFVAYYQGIWKCGLVFFMVFINLLSTPSRSLQPLLGVLLFLTIFMLPRVSKRARAMAYATKNNLYVGVGKKVEMVAEFMESDVEKTNEAQEAAANPVTMDGYRYLVGLKHLWKNKKYDRSPPSYLRDFDKEAKDIVTTQEIWQCQGELLTSMDSNGKLKDTCLSFALFWMLLRRYTGHPLSEVAFQKGKTWNFVRYGMIPEISTANAERTFRVIEQEISFLYDYFYTKNFVSYLYGFPSIIFQFVVMAAYLVTAQFILKSDTIKNAARLMIIPHFSTVELDIIVTEVVIYAMSVLEVALVVHYIFLTPWSRVRWVCIYVRKHGSQAWKDICQRWVIEKIIRISPTRNTKHWKRELDQYSLLRHYDYVSCTRFFICCLKLGNLRFFDVSKKGRKPIKSTPFSTDMKIAIISSLHTNGSQLTNGTSTLSKYQVHTEFSWACNLETRTQTIFVWHIATTYCELNHNSQDSVNAKKTGYFNLATSLSQYCAYLVFKPDLLPDQTNTTFKIFENLITEANLMFKGCSSMNDKYEKMRDMPDEFRGAKDPMLKKGICLGRSLVDRLSTEPLSNMLGEFWAELLLYLAPSQDVAAHLKQVANGGELITHLWTLLTHAGILTRD